MRLKNLVWLLVAVGFYGCDNTVDPPGPAPTNLNDVAVEAYIYGYPLVAAYDILHKQSLEPASSQYKGPFNQYQADIRLMTAADRTIISPNADTPYGLANLDLRNQGYVISVPEIDIDRYFSVQMVDMYTFNFAYLGKRATLNKAGTYLLCYSQNLIPTQAQASAAGIDSIICCETPFVQLFTRTQLYDDSDLDNVKAINNRITLRPLSDYLPGMASTEPPDYSSFPDPSDACLTTPEFYAVLDFVLSQCPVHPSEEALHQRFKSLGLDGNFDYAKLSADQKKALDYGLTQGLAQLSTAPDVDTRKIFGSRQQMQTMNGDDIYFSRAIGAFYGIYGNTVNEAMYFTYRTSQDGSMPDASKHDYQLTFDVNSLPPVNGFWSITMYGADKFFVDNPIDRYLVNSRMLDNGQLHVADGKLTVHIQPEAPTDPSEYQNWLPAPKGPFILILRLYLPSQDAITYKWQHPELIAVQ